MITPEDKIPFDDAQNDEADDQQSQKDIHSNGLDEEQDPPKDIEPETDLLNQAIDASESAYTLEPDKGIAPKSEEEDED